MLGFEDLLELVRTAPTPVWVLLPILFVSASVHGVQDFAVHRMQQFDLHGVQYGCQSAYISMEVKGPDANVLNRRCVLLRWVDLTREKFTELVERGTGSLLILMPADYAAAGSDKLKEWMKLEQYLLSSGTSIPVYFTIETPELSKIYEDVYHAALRDRNSTAVAVLLNIFTGRGYHVLTNGPETKPLPDAHVVNIQGKLSGRGEEESLPTLVIIAYYDASGLVTSWSHGADANGSGVVALLELARLLSRLYKDAKLRPSYNLFFVLSGGGTLNYFGAKGFIEQELEDSSSLLHNADYTICLNAVGAGNQLYVHTSKPPKQGSAPFRILQALNESARSISVNEAPMKVSLVHKKIRLSEDLLAWEHEKFSLQKVPAATISRHPSPHISHTTMFTNRSDVDPDILTRNVKLLAETIAHHVYNLSSMAVNETMLDLFTGDMSVNTEYMMSWLDHLIHQSRSPQLLTSENPLISALQETLSRYLTDVKITSHKPDKTDPEFVLYDATTTVLHVYSVKPAIFDLFLAFAIAIYLAFVYLVLNVVFPQISSFFGKYSWSVKVKTK